MKNIEDQILKLIDGAESILIMPSSPPDGDSVGSAVALYLALRKIGKTSTVVCADPVPEALHFLPMVDTVSEEFAPSPDFIITLDMAGAELNSIQSEVKENKINVILTAKKGRFSAENVSFSHGENRYDLILTVDTAALQQLGRFYEDNVSLFHEIPVINIDHHTSNEQFGLINYIDVLSSSTTELLISLLEAMEERYGREVIDEDIATLLLAGTITDTGSFQNSNTNPRSFANSAKLIRRGARQQEIIQHVFKTKRLSTLRLWGRILTNIKIEQKHRILWSVISKKDFLDTGSKVEEAGDIIDELMTNAPDVDVILLLKEKPDGSLSGSIRTMSDAVDATALAAYWGGGGHPKAAGFRIENTEFTKNVKEIIEKIKLFQEKRLNIPPAGETASPGDTFKAAKPEQAEKHPEETQKPKSQVTLKKDKPQDTPILEKNAGPQQMDPGALYKFE